MIELRYKFEFWVVGWALGHLDFGLQLDNDIITPYLPVPRPECAHLNVNVSLSLIRCNAAQRPGPARALPRLPGHSTWE